MNKRLGYCCINLSLADKKITTNRGMVKRTFLERGMDYASELALQNVKDLGKILEWNSRNGIRMYRISSDIFPWCSEYEISDLKDYKEISRILKSHGDYAKSTDQRLTQHPSHFAVLASDRPDIVQKGVKEINQHAELMDLMGLSRTHFNPINIHINTGKPTKEAAAERFCNNFSLLSDGAKSRLVLEIDDKKSQYNAQDLNDLVHSVIGIPITFDYLHNRCNPHPDLTEEQALKLCLSTWGDSIPLTHYSDSKKLYEDNMTKELAHTDWIWGNPETYGANFDIEFEVKMKDLALLKYINNQHVL